MSLFLDNDVIGKLAAWNLLDDGVAACGFARQDVRILATARFQLRVAGRRASRFPPDVHERIRDFVNAVTACPEAPPAEADALVRVDGIDAGEAMLFAQAAAQQDSLLITGDKRSIEAVARAAACTFIASRLRGRVLCLEQTLLRTIDLLGFEEVRGRMVESNLLTLDTAVFAAFGSGIEAVAHNAIESLERRVQSLARVAGDLLAPQSYRFAPGGSESLE